MFTIEQISNKVKPIAQKYKIDRIEIFGSYARGTNTEKSDVDFLVKFHAETPSIFDVCGFQEEVRKELSADVDVVIMPLSNPEKIRIERTVCIYG